MAFSLALSCVLLWSFLSFTTAFDITKILNQYSDYAVFNQELSKTHVAGEINKCKSVTVLVVPNGAMSGVTGLKDDSLSNIMKIHVVLDYYDSAKIKKLKDGTKVTTLYQTTGSAEKEEGFLKVQKDNNNNEIKLSSAVSGSQISARVNKVVTSIASDISVIEISSPIVPSGLDDSKTSGKSSSPSSSPSPSSDRSSPSSSPDSSPVKSPSKSKKKHSDAPSPSPKSTDSDSDDSPAPAPAPSHKHKHKHKHSHAPAPSDADAPSDEDADADADADDADADADADDEDDTDEDASSSSRNTVVAGGILLASFFATL